MYSPENQQNKIRILNDNLKDIKNELATQVPTMLSLKEQIKQESNILIADQKHVNALAVEAEGLKQENYNLSAKKCELVRVHDKLQNSFETKLDTTNELRNEMKQEMNQLGAEICQYADFLKEKASSFRKLVYNEKEVKAEIVKVTRSIAELETKLTQQQSIIEEKKRELDAIRADDIPENILDILGNSALDDKIKALTKKEETLYKKRKSLLNQRTFTGKLALKKF